MATCHAVALNGQGSIANEGFVHWIFYSGMRNKYLGLDHQ
jgi:hypothetical protein